MLHGLDHYNRREYEFSKRSSEMKKKGKNLFVSIQIEITEKGIRNTHRMYNGKMNFLLQISYSICTLLLI